MKERGGKREGRGKGRREGRKEGGGKGMKDKERKKRSEEQRRNNKGRSCCDCLSFYISIISKFMLFFIFRFILKSLVFVLFKN